MPPEACDVRVTDCPESIVGLEGVIAPADNVGFTVTKSVEANTVGGFVEASVTL